MKKKWIALVLILSLFAFMPHFSYSYGHGHHVGPLIVAAGIGGCLGWMMGTRTTVVTTQPASCVRWVCDRWESRWNSWHGHHETVCVYGHNEYYPCY